MDIETLSGLLQTHPGSQGLCPMIQFARTQSIGCQILLPANSWTNTLKWGWWQEVDPPKDVILAPVLRPPLEMEGSSCPWAG